MCKAHTQGPHFELHATGMIFAHNTNDDPYFIVPNPFIFTQAYFGIFDFQLQICKGVDG